MASKPKNIAEDERKESLRSELTAVVENGRKTWLAWYNARARVLYEGAGPILRVLRDAGDLANTVIRAAFGDNPGTTTARIIETQAIDLMLVTDSERETISRERRAVWGNAVGWMLDCGQDDPPEALRKAGSIDMVAGLYSARRRGEEQTQTDQARGQKGAATRSQSSGQGGSQITPPPSAGRSMQSSTRRADRVQQVEPSVPAQDETTFATEIAGLMSEIPPMSLADLGDFTGPGDVCEALIVHRHDGTMVWAAHLLDHGDAYALGEHLIDRAAENPSNEPSAVPTFERAVPITVLIQEGDTISDALRRCKEKLLAHLANPDEAFKPIFFDRQPGGHEEAEPEAAAAEAA